MISRMPFVAAPLDSRDCFLAWCTLGILLRHWSHCNRTHCNQLQWWVNLAVFHVDVSLWTVFRASFNTLSLFFRFFLDNSYTSRTWCSRSGSCRFFFLINLSVHNLIEVIYFLTCLYNMLTVHRVLRPDTNLADSSFSCVGRYALIAFRKVNLNQIPKIIPKIPVSCLH